MCIRDRICFQDLQHMEEGKDQGNSAYGSVFDLWVDAMASEYPGIQIPTHASKRGSSPAGNIVEESWLKPPRSF